MSLVFSLLRTTLCYPHTPSPAHTHPSGLLPVLEGWLIQPRLAHFHTSSKIRRVKGCLYMKRTCSRHASKLVSKHLPASSCWVSQLQRRLSHDSPIWGEHVVSLNHLSSPNKRQGCCLGNKDMPHLELQTSLANWWMAG